MQYPPLTDRSKKVIAFAHQEASIRDAKKVTAVHILIGLVKEGSGVGGTVLREFGLETVDIRKQLNAFEQLHSMCFSAHLEEILNKAFEFAHTTTNAYVGTEHLLLSILHSNDSQVNYIFKEMNISVFEITQRIYRIVDSPQAYAGMPQHVVESLTSILMDFSDKIQKLCSDIKKANSGDSNGPSQTKNRS